MAERIQKVRLEIIIIKEYITHVHASCVVGRNITIRRRSKCYQ